MSDKEKSIPAMSVSRTVEDDLGRIAFTFSADSLGDLMSKFNVQKVEEIPEQTLRSLCHMVGSSQIQTFVAKAEERSPGNVNIIAELGGREGQPATISSSDIGHDMFNRLVPEEDEYFGLLLDPQYSAVHVEIGVYNDDQSGAMPGERLSRTLLSTVLQPPNLT